MSKERLDWAKENERVGRNASWVARYYMVESYLRYRGTDRIYTYSSGLHPNCTDIDKYMGWRARSTESIVKNKELFTWRKDGKGWNCKELSYEQIKAEKVYYNVDNKSQQGDGVDNSYTDVDDECPWGDD